MILLRFRLPVKGDEGLRPAAVQLPGTDDNPYQSPLADAQTLQGQPRRRAPLVVRALLSGWTGMATALFMLVNVFLAVGRRPVAEPYIELVFVGVGMATLWFVGNAIAALIWR